MFSWLSKKAHQVSENSLIESIQEGNIREFGELYLRYVDSIYRYIYFRVNQDRFIAEDLTQMTFQNALIKIKSFQKDKGSFKSWIFRIAHNNVIDFYRQSSRQVKLSESISATEYSLEEDFDKKLQEESIQKALLLLTNEQKDVITMRFIEEIEISEIASILGKREEAIRAIQYRGLRELKRIMKK